MPPRVFKPQMELHPEYQRGIDVGKSYAQEFKNRGAFYDSLVGYDLSKNPSTDQDLRRVAIEDAKQRYESPTPEAAEYARSAFEFLKQRRDAFQAGSPDVEQALEAGAHLVPETIFLTEEQQGLISQDQPWRYSHDQAVDLMGQRIGGEEGLKLWRGIKMGTIKPEDLDEEHLEVYRDIRKERYGSQSMKGEGMLQGTLHALGASARAAAGVAGATRDVLAERTADIDPSDPKQTPAWRRAIGEFGGWLASEVKKDLFDVQMPGGGAVRTEPGLAEIVGAPIEGPAKVIESGRVAGVPVLEAAHAVSPMGIAQDPSILTDLWKRQAEYASKQFAGEVTDKESLQASLTRAKEHYRQAAEKIALQRLGDGPWSKEALQEEAASAFAELVNSDAAAAMLRDPSLGQFAVELFGDPLNFLGGAALKPITAPVKGLAKGVGWAGKKLAPGTAAKLERAGEALRAGFNRTYQGEKAIKKLQAAPEAGVTMGGEEAARAIDYAKDYGETVGRELYEGAKPYLSKLEGLKDAEKAVATDLLEGRIGIDEAKALLTDAGEGGRFNQVMKRVEAARKLGGELQQARAGLGLGKSFGKGGVLRESAYRPRQNYMPHRVREPITDPMEVTEDIVTSGLGQKDLTPGAEYVRRPEKYTQTKTRPVKDIERQFRADVAQRASTAAAAKELEHSARRFMDGGLIQKVPAGRPSQIDEKIKFLSDATGDKWTSLRVSDKGVPELVKQLEKVTGEVGKTKFGQSVYLMPEELVPYIRSTATFVRDPKVAVEATDALADGLLKGFWRPFSKTWRVGATLGGGPVYFMRNAATAAALPFIAHGMRAANPKMGGAAALGALASASIGVRAFRKMKVTLRSGEKVKLGKIVDELNKVGFLNTGDLRIGLELETKGMFGKVAEAAEKATKVISPIYLPMGKKLSARNVNNIIENYQKLATFLPFLDDMGAKSFEKALAKASEFAGNYRRLGTFEKNVMRDVSGFYSWNRFIWPLMAKQMVKNPQRLAAFVKARGYLEQRHGKEKPVNEIAVQKWLRAHGHIAPKEYQPPMDDQRLTEYGHDFAVRVIEDPISAGLGFIPVLESLISDKNVSDRERLQLFGILPKMMAELASGRDIETGEKLPVLPEWDMDEFAGDLGLTRFMSKAKASALASTLLAPIERPSRNFMTMKKLYYDTRGLHVDQLPLDLRYQAQRQLGILADIADLISGEERSLGAGGLQTVYLQKGMKNVAQAKGRATRRLREQERQLERATER